MFEAFTQSSPCFIIIFLSPHIIHWNVPGVVLQALSITERKRHFWHLSIGHSLKAMCAHAGKGKFCKRANKKKRHLGQLKGTDVIVKEVDHRSWCFAFWGSTFAKHFLQIISLSLYKNINKNESKGKPSHFCLLYVSQNCWCLPLSNNNVTIQIIHLLVSPRRHFQCQHFTKMQVISTHSFYRYW